MCTFSTITEFYNSLPKYIYIYFDKKKFNFAYHMYSKPSFPIVLPLSFVVARTMWYGWETTLFELFGPMGYQWDEGYFQQKIYRRIGVVLVENQVYLKISLKFLKD